MAAIRLAQAFGREAEELGRFHRSVRQSIEAWLRLHADEVRYVLAVGAIFAVFGAGIFGVGGWLVLRGDRSVGDLTVFLAYLGLLYDPLCKRSGASASLQAGAAGACRVFEVLDVLDRDPVIKDANHAFHLPVAPRTLSLDGVDFAYGSGRPVLRDVTTEIPFGRMVALVGARGVGKSTHLNLLPRFYDPTRGAPAPRWDRRAHRARPPAARRARAAGQPRLADDHRREHRVRPAERVPRRHPARGGLAGAPRFIDALPTGTRRRSKTADRTFRAGSRSASRSRARCSRRRPSSCSTSRRAASIPSTSAS